MKLVIIETYESVLPLWMIKPSNSTSYANYQSSEISSMYNDLSLVITFQFPTSMTYYYRFPENIGGGIARFGGMLAALRGLMIVMRWINRRQFEKKLTRFIRKEKANA
jgi:hypothetical protein